MNEEVKPIPPGFDYPLTTAIVLELCVMNQSYNGDGYGVMYFVGGKNYIETCLLICTSVKRYRYKEETSKEAN
jgi:hypothetical protein